MFQMFDDHEKLTSNFAIFVVIYMRGVYVCDHLFRIPAHAEFFGIFHLFTLFLEEFDYTARVQHVLHTTGYS